MPKKRVRVYSYEKNREQHKKRAYSPKTAVKQTVAFRNDMFFADMIDFGLVLLIPIYMLLNTFIEDIDSISSKWGGIVFAFVFIFLLYYGFFTFTMLPTIGRLVMGIRRVCIHDCQLAYKTSYNLKGEMFKKSLKYDNTYESLEPILTGQRESLVAREVGLITVDYRVYKLFIDDYFENGKLFKKKWVKPMEDNNE